MKHRPLILLLALGAACASGQSGRLADTPDAPPVSEREARARILDYARHWSGVVEEAADEIVRRADSAEIRHDAMRWKIDAVAACQTAAMRSDPVAAIVDVWALAMQMVDYLEAGPGNERFGPHREIALAAARRLEADAANVVQDDAVRERVGARIAEWVGENPVPRSIINRPSTMPVLAAMTGDPKLSAVAALRSTERRVGDLLERLDYYMEVLPQGIRWQMEYVVERYLLSQEEKRRLLQQFETMSTSLETVAALSRDVPDLMTAEREQIGRLLNEQREAVLAGVERERTEIMNRLAEEREAMFVAVDAQRKAMFAQLEERQESAFASLAAERESILAAVDEQRRETLAEIERLTRLAVAESGSEGRDAIDHFFRRAALVGGGLLALLFVAGLVFAKLVRRP